MTHSFLLNPQPKYPMFFTFSTTFFHSSTKFTYETETDHSLPFLDVQVTRSSERHTFETTIYMKPVFTGLTTQWNSFVPMSYKKASIDSMTRRALSICSTYPSWSAEFDDRRRIGQADNYPLSFINAHIGIGLNKYPTKKDDTNSPSPLATTTATTTSELKKKSM
jgi:hypothetical protein